MNSLAGGLLLAGPLSPLKSGPDCMHNYIGKLTGRDTVGVGTLTGMSGKNLWSSGLSDLHQLQREREIRSNLDAVISKNNKTVLISRPAPSQKSPRESLTTV